MTIKSNFPSIRPSLNLDFANTRALDPRITFTRTTTATYYDGKTTAKAEENLFLRSQEFNETIWTKTSVVATANTEVAPDGTTTAETITAVAAASVHAIVQSVPTNSLIRTVSVFAKEGTHSYIQFCTQGDVTPFANFDLDLGVVGTKAASVTSSITSVGNGWYRCTMEYTSATATTIDICLVSSDSATRRESWTALGTETVYLWGAQLEQRSAVSAYTATTTQPITNYIPALQTAASGVARFDHRPLTGESLGLLVEEQRTNLCLQSEDFSTTWTTTQGTVTTNQLISPSGTLTADQFEDTGAASGLIQSITVSANTTHTTSVYLKRSNNDFYRLYWGDASFTNGIRAWVNLSTGALGTVSASGSSSNASATITAVGNGWYRCTLTGIIDNSTTAGRIQINSASADGSATRVTGAKVFIWGAQLEAGAFPTSYIPTVAASVTRNADAASMTGTNFSSWYRADEGSVYCDYQTVDLASFSSMVAISDGTTNNRIQLAHASASRRFVVTTSGAGQVDTSPGSDTASVFSKLCAAYKTNDFAVYANGITLQTDTGGTIPSVDRVFIGATATGTSSYLNGTIKKIAFYPSRLSNAQLQALTTV
jgi:hypothetical protein